MTDLRVMKGGDWTWTNIEVDKNVTISNRYNLGEKLKYGEVQAEIRDGEVYTKRNGKDKEENLTFDRLSLSEKKYNVFMEICKLDGNADNFTQQDAVLATQLNQDTLDKLGIVRVIKDFAKGVVQLVLGNGQNDVLTFDFETENEQNNRKGSYKVEKDTNALDLADKLGISRMKLLDANPEFHTMETLSLKEYDASADAEITSYEYAHIPAGSILTIPFKLENCWEDKYK